MFFALPVWWDHNCNRLTNHLFGSVAENTLSTAIPACNNAVEVFAHDRVVIELDDRCQPAQSLVAFLKLGFNLFALGNVAIDFKHGVVAEQLHPTVYEDLAAILADVTEFARPITCILQMRT